MSIRLEWKPQDLWIGVFWRRTPPTPRLRAWGWCDARWDVWICLLPCLPIHVWWYRGAVVADKELTKP